MNMMVPIVAVLECKQCQVVWIDARSRSLLVISDVKAMVRAWALEFHLGTDSSITSLVVQVA